MVLMGCCDSLKRTNIEKPPNPQAILYACAQQALTTSVLNHLPSVLISYGTNTVTIIIYALFTIEGAHSSF